MNRKRLEKLRAFTLVELLVVVAILGILAALTFGALSGVSEKQLITQAQSEMTAIKVALEDYKSDFGDYPRHGTSGGGEEDANRILLKALCGLVAPDGTTLAGDNIRNPYIDLERFEISFENDDDLEAFLISRNPDALNDVELLDPWGGFYRYYYDQIASTTTWRNPDYVIYSDGPDLDSEPPVALDGNGVITPSDLSVGALNLDNVLPR